MNETFTTKVGANHGKPASRVWLEGARLVNAGFRVGTRYGRVLNGETLTLLTDDKGAYKVSGKGEKPIIDITGKLVTDTFTTPTVDVTYENGVITVRETKEAA